MQAAVQCPVPCSHCCPEQGARLQKSFKGHDPALKQLCWQILLPCPFPFAAIYTWVKYISNGPLNSQLVCPATLPQSSSSRQINFIPVCWPQGELDRVHPHDACILSRISASMNNVLCLLNRLDFSSGALTEAQSEFSPTWSGRASAQRLSLA